MTKTNKIKKLPAIFFRSEQGAEPVRDWLQAFSDEDKKVLGTDIATVEYGWPIGMPLCRNLGDGLWEIRVNLSGKRIARIIFFADNNVMILTHAFVKKTQKTPKQDLDLSKQRMKEYMRRKEVSHE